MAFAPSPQQSTFFNWIRDDQGSCVLEAVAGAGKTTTLIQALSIMTGNIFFGAYNKKIAEEIASRAPRRQGLDISTMHAAGFKAWRKAAPRVNVEANKVRDIYRAACVRNVQYVPFEGPVLQLVSYAKQAAFGVRGYPSTEDKQSWLNLVQHFDVETFDEDANVDNTDLIIKLARKTLEASIQQNLTVIDFDDMIYAPLIANASIWKYDWVLVDEAQDTNASRRELALRMLKKGARLVAVGDRHQAIYGFTGADSDSLDLIGRAVNAKQLPLTTTFRCPKAVVSYAHQWVCHIEAATTAPDGIVRSAEAKDFSKEAQVGDAVLCRFNAPLVSYVYKLIAAGIPARIEGREIGNGLKQLARRWKVKDLNKLLEKLEVFLERETQKLRAKEQENRATAVEDKVECLRVIINRVLSKDPQGKVADVVEEIDNIFGAEDSQKPVVLLSSIHKSKGREWNKVIWLQTKPNGRARQDWELEQETNLCYVAATRAKHELVLIDISAEDKK